MMKKKERMKFKYKTFFSENEDWQKIQFIKILLQMNFN